MPLFSSSLLYQHCFFFHRYGNMNLNLTVDFRKDNKGTKRLLTERHEKSIFYRLEPIMADTQTQEDMRSKQLRLTTSNGAQFLDEVAAILISQPGIVFYSFFNSLRWSNFSLFFIYLLLFIIIFLFSNRKSSKYSPLMLSHKTI